MRVCTARFALLLAVLFAWIAPAQANLIWNLDVNLPERYYDGATNSFLINPNISVSGFFEVDAANAIVDWDVTVAGTWVESPPGPAHHYKKGLAGETASYNAALFRIAFANFTVTPNYYLNLYLPSALPTSPGTLNVTSLSQGCPGCTDTSIAGFDYGFITTSPVSPINGVPEPATVVLLGLGVIGIGLSRRRAS